MKKIIAILLALALVSMAFAQTVTVKNTVETKPTVTIDGAVKNWRFDPGLHEKVEGEATTADGRAWVKGVIGATLNWKDNTNANLLSFRPRWNITTTDTAAGAWFKPFDFLKVHVGGNGMPGIPGIQNWEKTWLQGMPIKVRNLAGNWEGTGMGSGVVVGFTGIDKLGIYGGILTETWLKKGAFGGFQLGVTYGGGKWSGDIFSVGATWKGKFGGYNPAATTSVVKSGNDVGDTDKKYQSHTLWVGATFKGLSDLKVGITLDGTVGFNYEKASQVMNTKQNTSFLVSLSPTFNFRNGISDQVIVSVGYNKYDGKKAKVLPFMVSNKFTYSISGDASFGLYAAYEQGALADKKNTFTGAGIVKDPSKVAAYKDLNNTDAAAAIIIINPSFSFNLGKHGFTIGVEANVLNDLQYHKKTAQDWAFTNIKGISADLSIPLSWTYTF